MIATEDIGAAARTDAFETYFNGKQPRVTAPATRMRAPYQEVAAVIGKGIGKPDLAYMQFPPDN